ncbi:Similar to hypothetical protein [Tuber melanosporum Mel28]; acc. no. XP_002841066 [Pyronema omphalodes CBS 100304]|uniref:Uncharacterized protein n=1 Tax=Pyronema omphalodes (strain CBS 100304) TaxID=1076935 RepID=U4L4X4_PYROM|nr:Similar to hypothetical protein [Tuber melanosporum Mel28]; acc. no. XP_002841066 [Pyronema omphalodes CBS 100304]
MPRTLPWLQTTSSASNATSKPTKPANPSKTTDEISSASKPSKKRQTTLKPAPDEDFSTIGLMLPTDSHWIMVEDEFLSTAQLFTRSLHRLEYQRLQLEATSRNASKISHIQRPVISNGPSQDALKLRSLAAKVQAQEAAISRKRQLRDMARDEEGEDGEESEEEDEGLETGLGLMMSQRLPGHRGLGELMQRGKVKTRAAEGFKDSVPTASPVKRGQWQEGREVPGSPISRRQGTVAGLIRLEMRKKVMLQDEEEAQEAEETEYDSDNIDAGYMRRMELQKKAALRAAKEAATKEAEAARMAEVSRAEVAKVEKAEETKETTDSDFDSDDLDAPIHRRFRAAKKAEAAKRQERQAADPSRSIPTSTIDPSLHRISLSSMSVQRSGTSGISGTSVALATLPATLSASAPTRTATDPSVPTVTTAPEPGTSVSTSGPQRMATAPVTTTKYVSDDDDDDWIVKPIKSRFRGRSAVLREQEKREKEMEELRKKVSGG